MSIQQTFKDVDTVNINVGEQAIEQQQNDITVTEPKENWYDEETGEKKCNWCGNWYKSIGQHWRQSNCDHPEPTDRQMEIMRGMMLGDGSIHKNGLYFQVEMTNKLFIEWLAGELGYLWTHNISMTNSGVKSRSGVVQDSNILDIYRIWTHRGIQKISGMRSWYENNKDRKLYPDNIRLTPLVLKMWYVSDWTYVERSDQDWVILNKELFDNETEMLLKSWFDSFGWVYNRREVQEGCDKFVFTIDSTQEIFDYIGDPVPGFEYKWPDGPTYEQAKQRHCTVNGEPYYPGIHEDQESEM